MNCSDISQKYDRPSGTRQRIFCHCNPRSTAVTLAPAPIIAHCGMSESFWAIGLLHRRLYRDSKEISKKMSS
ncbi:MAG: hypothetical protein JGK17_14835 [Microcoleus sp. PH2017_10_PVI_O_A]|nr:hypothetical protein [Microcoleus sp. PH2017_10_PVI_O_A]